MENQVAELKRTVGNFTGYPSKNFPLDADGLNDMQLNDALLSVLGNIGGNKYILMGCVKDGTVWNAGFIFVATTKFPAGELLYVESGTGDVVYLDSTSEDINASGYNYTAAYTKRKCKHGLGDEQFNLTTFQKISTNEELLSRIVALENTIVTPEAIGTIKMWPSLNMPNDSWAMCDGSTLNKNIYPALFGVIGYSFPPNNSGDLFNLPDMRSRFPVAYNAGDGDYNAVGKKGGNKQHTISILEMPSHKHKLYMGFSAGTSGTQDKVSYNRHADGIFHDSWVEEKGGGQPFTHIPEYFAIPFIIKIK